MHRVVGPRHVQRARVAPVQSACSARTTRVRRRRRSRRHWHWPALAWAERLDSAARARRRWDGVRARARGWVGHHRVLAVVDDDVRLPLLEIPHVGPLHTATHTHARGSCARHELAPCPPPPLPPARANVRSCAREGLAGCAHMIVAHRAAAVVRSRESALEAVEIRACRGFSSPQPGPNRGVQLERAAWCCENRAAKRAAGCGGGERGGANDAPLQ